MGRKPPRGTFAAAYDDAKRSVGRTSKSLMARRRRKWLEDAIKELAVDAFDYGVRWALLREWTEHEKRYILEK